MIEKPARPDRQDPGPTPDETPVRSDDAYRRACRHYSRLRARQPD
jgi:hypothetical protein